MILQPNKELDGARNNKAAADDENKKKLADAEAKLKAATDALKVAEDQAKQAERWSKFRANCKRGFEPKKSTVLRSRHLFESVRSIQSGHF